MSIYTFKYPSAKPSYIPLPQIKSIFLFINVSLVEGGASLQSHFWGYMKTTVIPVSIYLCSYIIYKIVKAYYWICLLVTLLWAYFTLILSINVFKTIHIYIYLHLSFLSIYLQLLSLIRTKFPEYVKNWINLFLEFHRSEIDALPQVLYQSVLLLR